MAVSTVLSIKAIFDAIFQTPNWSRRPFQLLGIDQADQQRCLVDAAVGKLLSGGPAGLVGVPNQSVITDSSRAVIASADTSRLSETWWIWTALGLKDPGDRTLQPQNSGRIPRQAITTHTLALTLQPIIASQCPFP